MAVISYLPRGGGISEVVTTNTSTLLYSYGDECTETSGGWTPIKWRGTLSSLTRTKNADHLYAIGTTNGIMAWGCFGWSTAKKIDVTNYTTLRIVMTGYCNPGNTGVYFGLVNELLNDKPSNAATNDPGYASYDWTGGSAGSTTPKTVTLDISNLTGQYYIYVWSQAIGDGYGAINTGELFVYEVELL